MARFYGVIGYATQTEKTPGVWVDAIEEVNVTGEILQNHKRWEATETLNDNLVISNKFSVVSQAALETNAPQMRYIQYMGSRWSISSLEIKRPRIIITTGGLYNGQIPS